MGGKLVLESAGGRILRRVPNDALRSSQSCPSRINGFWPVATAVVKVLPLLLSGILLAQP